MMRLTEYFVVVMTTASLPALSSSAYTMRLVAGGDHYGRLEISGADDTNWGTICDDNFTNFDAIVACNILGYSFGISAENAFGAGNGTIHLDEIECFGGETTLFNCHHDGWNVHDCSHDEDVGVICYNAMPSQVRLSGSGLSSEGILEVRLQNTWGTVSSTMFSARGAEVVCKMLGHLGGTVVPNTPYTMSSGIVWFRSVYCTGTETNIDQCSNGFFCSSCQHSEDVAVKCERTLSPSINVFCDHNGTITVTGIPTGQELHYKAVQQLSNGVVNTCIVSNSGLGTATITGCVVGQKVLFASSSRQRTSYPALLDGGIQELYEVTCEDVPSSGISMQVVGSTLQTSIQLTGEKVVSMDVNVSSFIYPPSVVVGDSVFWEIRYPSGLILEVTNCSAHAGTGFSSQSIPLITLGGCTAESELISDFTDSGNGSAVAVLEAFKFVSSNYVFLACDIRICPNLNFDCDSSCSATTKRNVLRADTETESYDTHVQSILYVESSSFATRGILVLTLAATLTDIIFIQMEFRA